MTPGDEREREQTAAQLTGAAYEAQLVRVGLRWPAAACTFDLTPGYFDVSSCRAVWRVVMEIGKSAIADQPCDLAMLRTELESHGMAPSEAMLVQRELQLDDQAQIASLGYASAVLVPWIVNRASVRQWNGSNASIGSRVEVEADMGALRADFVDLASRIAVTPEVGVLGGDLGEMASEWNDDPDVPTVVIPTSIPQIDERTGGGLGPGDMMVLGGGVSHGKSYEALKICVGRAALGLKSLYLSAEDDADLVMCRLIAHYADPAVGVARVRAKKVERSTVSAARERMQEALSGLAYFRRVERQTATQIARLIADYRYRQGVDLVVVDYLQAIAPEDPDNTNKTQTTTETVDTLKQCVHNLGVALVLPSQYTRDGYRAGAEPQYSDLKWSGDIEARAQAIALLWRDEEEIVRVKLAKLKWNEMRGARYVVPVDPVNGWHGDWEVDMSEPKPAAEPRKRERTWRKNETT